MNLLAATLYDPAGAVSKATDALLEMTAFDTTNLRLTATVPAHGMLMFRLRTVRHGAGGFPQILLGVLNGATVVGRVGAAENISSDGSATVQVKLWSEFVAVGLTPGSTNFDAAYGVEVVSGAGGAIKYGGPDDTTGDNAFGAFQFEIWDPSSAVSDADALLKRDMSAVTGESARSPLNAIRFLRNKWDVAGGVLTVKKEDDATTAWTAAITSNASAKPIVGSDPA